MEETAIYLTAQEVEQFKQFSKHYEFFSILEQKGIFSIGWGKCTLNFANGVLQNVIKEEIVYKK